ncbi:glycosyltransferase family A protein [Methylocaldum sp.]|uniref:glycosyltransferase family 2 protein n=1 Tax=Methylocaldum sp. TaxID=1969727 RepID=UPI002D43E95B|nr:glycosyltransferase family A protein [Methylocaldum sp.]HYE37377.1 glycosyltransferase family A protein [Methylocaldum sp.]
METLFSIVIPAYNRTATIRACLDSVLTQRSRDFEVVVVDDGSEDDTVEIVESYGDEVRLIRQRNRGAGAARNTGIQAANGEYIVFLDGDDAWFPYTLGHYAACIERFERPSLLIGQPLPFVDEIPVPPADAPLKAIAYPNLQFFLKEHEPMMHATGTLVARKDALLAAGGFVERQANCEDTDIVLKLSTAPGFVFIRTPPAYAFRKAGNSLSTHIENNFRGITSVIDRETKGEYPGGFEGRKSRWRLIAYVARAFSVKLAQHGRPDLAFAVYRKVFRQQLVGMRMKYLIGFPVLAAYMKCKWIMNN